MIRRPPKYIEYLEFARALDLEIAGEYLVMAATLAYLKSRELLPPDPTEEEELEGELESVVDPREELIRRLLEYERFRHAGDELNQRAVMGRDVFTRGGDIGVDPIPPGLAPITLFRLAEAYNRILDKAKIRKSHEVVIERVTVRERISQLGLMLRDNEELDFESMFMEREWNSQDELRQMLVVTLMSILEMVKMGIMGIHQAQGSGTLALSRTVPADELIKTVETFQGGSFET
jgi:segregation and condensation protein A